MRAALLVVAALVVGVSASAQSLCTGTPPNTVCTGPIPATAQIAWDAPDNVPSIPSATALEPRVRVDGATAFTVLTDTCTGSAVPFRCQAPIPTALLTTLNAVGAHTVTVALYDPSTGLEGPSAIPFALRNPPAAPSGVGMQRANP